MSRKPGHVPSYRLHKPSGQARVIIDGEHIYLGAYGSPESHERYARLIAERAVSKNGGTSRQNGNHHATPVPGVAADLLVSQLVLKYDDYAKGYYTRDSEPGKECTEIKLAMRPLLRLYGAEKARDFGPLALKAVRQSMVDSGLSRGVVNHRVNKIKRMFKWAVSEELLPSSVYEGLRTVAGLIYGRTAAKEAEPIKPVERQWVDAILLYVSPPVAAMIQVHWLAGMRACEVVVMRPCDIDRTGDIWIYEPFDHKNRWRGHDRKIPLGPKVQQILKPFLNRDPETFLFNPRDAEEWRRAQQRKNRKTPMTPSQAKRKRKAKPKRILRDHYDTASYHGAIEYGIKKANRSRDGQPFDHLVYHWVLTYSNWESVTICFSESFESLSEGIQNAVWELGGVPQRHRTDRMSLAVNNASSEKEFTRRYRGLLDYYGLEMEKIQPEEPHENGDAEQSHRRFKEAVEQALLLRGQRDFESRAAYERFLRELVAGRNAGRRKRLDEELSRLRRLPARRRESYKRLSVSVDRGSLIHVDRNAYSVPSRLMGERVQVRLYVEHVEIWYAQQEVERFPRLRGRRKRRINYRHIIDWLVRKPGAFENYVYREDLFPTSRFRMAYDALQEAQPGRGHKEYLGILYLAARHSETAVDEALRTLLASDRPVTKAAVEELVHRAEEVPAVTEVTVEEVDLLGFDDLFLHKEVWDGCEGGCEGEVDGLLAGTALADVSGVF